MSRKGNCWDNAQMKSCGVSLKNELVHHRPFATRTDAKREITEYIEIFYNSIRKQARLGYLCLQRLCNNIMKARRNLFLVLPEPGGQTRL